MNLKHPHIQRATELLQLILFAVIFVAGVSYMQAAFTAPTVQPPTPSVSVPLNTSTVFQDKPAGVEAAVIGVDNGVILNGVESLVWPTDLNQTASCRFEVRRVNSMTRRFFEDHGDPGGQLLTYAQWHYHKCGDYLTPEAIADGWVPSGGDNCDAVYGDVCQFPSTCTYARLKCASGITVVSGLMTTSTYQGSPIAVPTISTTTIPL